MVTSAKEQEYLTKIHTQEAVIEQLKKELELHSKQNDLLQQQVNALTEILIQMRNDKFGSKSEKTKVLDNQLNFFNEPELFADAEEAEPIVFGSEVINKQILDTMGTIPFRKRLQVISDRMKPAVISNLGKCHIMVSG